MRLLSRKPPSESEYEREGFAGFSALECGASPGLKSSSACRTELSGRSGGERMEG